MAQKSVSSIVAQGAERRPLLVVYGIDKAGRRRAIGLRLAPTESEAAWTALLTSLWQRGLTGERLELVITDGAPGLIRAVETVWPLTPRQRCWAHMMRNVVGACPKRLAPEVATAARKIYLARSRREAIARFHHFKCRWTRQVPKAVAKIKRALDELVAFSACAPAARRAVRTTNAIERLFVELRRLSYAICAAYTQRRHRLKQPQTTSTALAA